MLRFIRICLFTSLMFLSFISIYAKSLDADSLFELANEQINKQEISLAKSNLQKAISAYQTLPNKGDYQKAIGRCYNTIGNLYHNENEYIVARSFHKKALRTRLQISDTLGTGDSYNNIGTSFLYQGIFDSSLYYLYKAQAIYERLNHRHRLGMVYNNIGFTHYRQGNYMTALEPFFNALKTYEALGDKTGKANAYNNIGKIYNEQDENKDALRNYNLALKLYKSDNNQSGVANVYNNIGTACLQEGDYAKSIVFYQKALLIYKKTGDKTHTALALNNIALAYINSADYVKAETTLKESLNIRESIGDQEGIAQTLTNLGNVCTSLQQYDEATNYLKRALKVSKEINSKKDIQYSYQYLSTLKEAQGKYNESLGYFKKYILYRDSLQNEENIKLVTQREMQYEFDRQQELIIAEQEKRELIYQTKVKKRQLIIYFACGMLLLTIGFSYWVYQQFLEKKQINEELDTKNKEITDSINYTLRIQKALMKSRKEINKGIYQNLIVYQPKDIVSGDFYFYHETDNHIYIAAADCTGHGIPGAFMSVLSIEKLKEAINFHQHPGEILQYTNKAIKKSLQQTMDIESTKDGMDIAFCSINKTDNTIEYAGANRPLWIVKENGSEVEEIRATKKGIAGHTEDEQKFDTHQVKITSKDTIYIHSDGYADQFGGEKGKKMMTKRFKQLLVDIKSESLSQQEEKLLNFYNNWKQDYEQIDDVLVIGFRV